MDETASPELFKDVVGYEGLYEISNLGAVRNVLTGRVLKDSAVHGYRQITLRKNGCARTVRIHRLVAMAFCPGYSAELDVNHIDLIKANNKATNLEWVTKSQNVRHAILNGARPARVTTVIGEKHHHRLLSDAREAEMIEATKTMIAKDVAKLFGVSRKFVLAKRAEFKKSGRIPNVNKPTRTKRP